jgi:hypothetical protein
MLAPLVGPFWPTGGAWNLLIRSSSGGFTAEAVPFVATRAKTCVEIAGDGARGFEEPGV